MDGLHKLEASKPEVGGLIIKRSADKKDDVFKMPKYGLDLMAKKLRKERENSSLLSFKTNDDDETEAHSSESKDLRPALQSSVTKNYRTSNVESTPGASASETVKKYYDSKKSEEKHKGLYYSSSKKKDDRRRRDDDKSERRRHRDRSDRSDRRDHSDRRSRRRSPETPRQYNSDGGRIRSNWDDDDDDYPDRKKSRSSWDCPTPSISSRHRSEDRSTRSSSGYGSHRRERSRRNESETPRATPAYKYNKWATDRRESGATPRVDGKNFDGKKPWEEDDFDREAWEEEQKRLDREWYNMDDGYDEDFANESSEYLKKREEANEAKRKKKMSAQQRQINKDNELWEKNRMLTSGVVTSINVNEDFEEESVERVHLLVHHTIPPFLDGRIVFTKVMGKIRYFYFLNFFIISSFHSF